MVFVSTNLKNRIYLENSPDFVSNDLDFKANYAGIIQISEKGISVDLMTKKHFPITQANQFSLIDKTKQSLL